MCGAEAASSSIGALRGRQCPRPGGISIFYKREKIVQFHVNRIHATKIQLISIRPVKMDDDLENEQL